LCLFCGQDYPEAIYLYKVHKFDFVVWVIAFLGTLFLGVQQGLAIAVAISLFLVIWESAYPHIAELGRLPGTTLYRNVAQYAGELFKLVIVVL
jgi:sulfate transporter 4